MTALDRVRYYTTPIHLKYEVRRKIERATIWVVWKLPKSLVYWSAIRVGANATTGKYSDQVVPDLLFMDALKRWDGNG